MAESEGELRCRPKVQTIESVPRDGWDEWYIFDEARDLGTSRPGENISEVPRGPGHVSVFVNYCYTFHRPEHQAFGPFVWRTNGLDAGRIIGGGQGPFELRDCLMRPFSTRFIKLSKLSRNL